MELNPEITEILKEFKIDKDQGLLCLLGYYFKLDVDKVCSEETVKAISLTKIVEKDIKVPNILTWNMSLFLGQNTQWDWVTEWLDGFGKINSERRGSPRDAITRMQDFFKKYPEYRKEDVFKARDAYFSSVIKKPGGAVYLMKSHKFIFDGQGAMKKSELLAWCEKVKQNLGDTSYDVRGKVL